jgi:hypothetical protein
MFRILHQPAGLNHEKFISWLDIDDYVFQGMAFAQEWLK